MHAPLGDGLQPQEIPQVYPKTRKERGGKPFFVFLPKTVLQNVAWLFLKAPNLAHSQVQSKKQSRLKRLISVRFLKIMGLCNRYRCCSVAFILLLDLKSNLSNLKLSKNAF